MNNTPLTVYPSQEETLELIDQRSLTGILSDAPLEIRAASVSHVVCRKRVEILDASHVQVDNCLFGEGRIFAPLHEVRVSGVGAKQNLEAQGGPLLTVYDCWAEGTVLLGTASKGQVVGLSCAELIAKPSAKANNDFWIFHGVRTEKMFLQGAVKTTFDQYPERSLSPKKTLSQALGSPEHSLIGRLEYVALGYGVPSSLNLNGARIDTLEILYSDDPLAQGLGVRRANLSGGGVVCDIVHDYPEPSMVLGVQNLIFRGPANTLDLQVSWDPDLKNNKRLIFQNVTWASVCFLGSVELPITAVGLEADRAELQDTVLVIKAIAHIHDGLWRGGALTVSPGARCILKSQTLEGVKVTVGRGAELILENTVLKDCPLELEPGAGFYPTDSSLIDVHLTT